MPSIIERMRASMEAMRARQELVQRNVADAMSVAIAAANAVSLPPVANDPQKAEERSLELLLDWLTPAQRTQYAMNKSFDVISSTGKRFRITDAVNYGVIELDADGVPVRKYCFLPDMSENQFDYVLPAIGDQMLAQKIALETDEQAALGIANNHPLTLVTPQTPITDEAMRLFVQANEFVQAIANPI